MLLKMQIINPAASSQKGNLNLAAAPERDMKHREYTINKIGIIIPKAYITAVTKVLLGRISRLLSVPKTTLINAATSVMIADTRASVFSFFIVS